MISEVRMMADKEITFEKTENGGLIKIADEVIMAIAAQAVGDICGVTIAATLAEGLVDKLVKKNNQRGIRIHSDDTTGTTDIEVHINVAYGVNILEVCWSVQESVRKNITAMTDVNVGKVNVFVDGVTIEKEPKPEKVKEIKKEE